MEMLLPSDWKRFVELLNSNAVEYVLTGAYALAYHGWPRPAPNIEFFVRAGTANAARLKTAIDTFQLSSLNIQASELAQGGRVFQFGNPPLRIDVATSLPGVTFDQAWAGKARAVVDSIPVWIIGKAEFVASKLASGSAIDAAESGLVQP